MTKRWVAWSVCGLPAFLSACSGKLNDLGDIGSGGTSNPTGAHAGASSDAGMSSAVAGASASGGSPSVEHPPASSAGTTSGSGATDSSAGVSSSAGAGTSCANAQAGSAGSQSYCDLAGSWNGYVENFEFEDDSDSIAIALDGSGKASMAIFGKASAPPPATDANADYPPGRVLTVSTLMDPPPSAPVPGFAYTIENAVRSGDRFQFDVESGELYESYCALQTPYENSLSTTGYACLPNWAGGGDGVNCSITDPATKQQVTRSCTQLSMCMFSNTCRCDASSCQTTPLAVLHFDLNLSVGKADGSVSGLDGTSHDVHLTR